MHVIPQLRKLERKFDKELVVIGVHSAKFASEKETDNIRQAVLRYGIRHPVVNDDRFATWTAYGVHAWPTIAVIDPLGRIATSLAGEFRYEQMERFIGGLVSRLDPALMDRSWPAGLASRWRFSTRKRKKERAAAMARLMAWAEQPCSCSQRKCSRRSAGRTCSSGPAREASRTSGSRR
jgi:hypothetical protein